MDGVIGAGRALGGRASAPPGPRRPPRAHARHPARPARAAHPQARDRPLLPALPGAAEHRREGARGARRRPRSDGARGSLHEARVAGASTRKGDDLVQAVGLRGISRSPVSERCRETCGRAGALLARTLEGERPRLRLDATRALAGAGSASRCARAGFGAALEPVAGWPLAASAAAMLARGGPRRTARDRGPAHRPLGGRGLLACRPRGPRAARPRGREARDPRRARGAEGRDPPRSAATRHVVGAPWQGGRVPFMRSAPAPLCPRAGTPCSPPRSARPSRSPTARPPARPGGTWPTRRAPAGRSSGRSSGHARGRGSWTRSRPTPDRGPGRAVPAHLALPTQRRTKSRRTSPLGRPNREPKRCADVVGARAALGPVAG